MIHVGAYLNNLNNFANIVVDEVNEQLQWFIPMLRVLNAPALPVAAFIWTLSATGNPLSAAIAAILCALVSLLALFIVVLANR